MKFQVSVLFAVLALPLGCIDGGGSSGGGLELGSLSGTYELDEGCTVVAEGARATVDNCTLENFVPFPVDITGSAVFHEEEISLSGTGDEHFTSYCYEATCEVEASGSLDKLSGRQEDGPFEAFAGEWAGSIQFTRSCADVQIVEGRENDCEPADDIEESDEFNVTASIYGSRIDASPESHGNFSVEITDDLLIVNGESIPRQ